MSARAVLDSNLKIVEIPMIYRELLGESKLGLIRDGIRFLTVILEIALMYRPLRFHGSIGILFILAALFYGIHPLSQYIQERKVEEWMIYRLLAVTVFTVAGLNLTAIGLLANNVVQSVQRLHHQAVSGRASSRFSSRIWQNKLLNLLPLIGTLLTIAGVILNKGVLGEYLTTGHITAHWTYPVTGSFFILTGLQLFSFGVIHRIFSALEDKQVFLFTSNTDKDSEN